MTSDRLLNVRHSDDILREWQRTPIVDFLQYHNLGADQRDYERAELLICACMDFRVSFNIPDKFAYIIRTPGANLIENQFGLVAALTLADVHAVALVAHTDCAMTKVRGSEERIVSGLFASGWDENTAQRFYAEQAGAHALTNPTDFVIRQCQTLRKQYTNVIFAPLVYDVADGKLWQARE